MPFAYVSLDTMLHVLDGERLELLVELQKHEISQKTSLQNAPQVKASRQRFKGEGGIGTKGQCVRAEFGRRALHSRAGG